MLDDQQGQSILHLLSLLIAITPLQQLQDHLKTLILPEIVHETKHLHIHLINPFLAIACIHAIYLSHTTQGILI